MRTQCSTEFAEKYDIVLDNLVKMSRPATRDCPAPGESMDRSESVRMAKLFEQEFGQSYMEMAKAEVSRSRVLYAEKTKAGVGTFGSAV